MFYFQILFNFLKKFFYLFKFFKIKLSAREIATHSIYIALFVFQYNKINTLDLKVSLLYSEQSIRNIIDEATIDLQHYIESEKKKHYTKGAIYIKYNTFKNDEAILGKKTYYIIDGFHFSTQDDFTKSMFNTISKKEYRNPRAAKIFERDFLFLQHNLSKNPHCDLYQLGVEFSSIFHYKHALLCRYHSNANYIIGLLYKDEENVGILLKDINILNNLFHLFHESNTNNKLHFNIINFFLQTK